MKRLSIHVRNNYILAFFVFMILIKCVSFDHSSKDPSIGLVGEIFAIILLFIYIICLILRIRGDSMTFYRRMLIAAGTVELIYLIPKYVISADILATPLQYNGYYYIAEIAFAVVVNFVLIGEILYMRQLESDASLFKKADK